MSICLFIFFVPKCKIYNKSFKMEENNRLEPRQKNMTILHRKYANAMFLLKQNKLDEGATILYQVIGDEYMSDTDMENLKYACLMSLAQINEVKDKLLDALSCYWGALSIISNQAKLVQQKVQQNLKYWNQQKSDDEFIVLSKMILLIQRLNQPQHYIYLLKRALKVSPLIWRQRLLNKLESVYQSEGKLSSLADLKRIRENKQLLQQILFQKTMPQEETNSDKNIESIVRQLQNQPFLKKITFKINLLQKQQHKNKYSCWQILLTITYILLKCQASRNFNKKKYLHKKFDETNKQWINFLKEFHLIYTSIEIVFVQQNEEAKNIDIEQGKDILYGQLVSDLANELLRCQYFKKKSKKTHNPIQQIIKLPLLISKDSKKVSTTQTKSVYSSIYEFYKEIFLKNNFNKKTLNCLKAFNGEIFDKIFQKIVNYETDQLQVRVDEENQDCQGQNSVSAQLGSLDNDKQSLKEKKLPKTRKHMILTYHSELNSCMMPIFQSISSEQASLFSFNNVLQLIEQLTYYLIKEKVDKKKLKQTCILNALPIRSLLQKNILKIIQNCHGFFSKYLAENVERTSFSEDRIQFLELLIDKLQHLIDKDSKNKVFKAYQQSKKQTLINYIKDHFTPSTYQLYSILHQDLSFYELKYFSALTLSFIKLNYQHQNKNQSEISYYKDLFIAFKSKEEKLHHKNGLNQSQIEKRVINFIEKELQKYQKKINNRTSILNLTEDNQENKSNIDQLYNKDMEISIALQLLKQFSTIHHENFKPKHTDGIQQINGATYLQSFIKIAQLFFKKIQLQSQKEFNSRLLTIIGDIMKIKLVIGDIYEKFMYCTTFKSADIDHTIMLQALFYLLRFYLLNLYEENDNCIRIIFFITGLLFRNLSDQAKYYAIPKIIYLFDELIKYKKFKPEILSVVKKKFYQNLIVKNLNFIYLSPIFAISQDKGTKSKKNLRKKSESQQSLGELKNRQVKDENEELKQKVQDILHDIYFCPQKQKQFNPKKLEQAVGCLMYLMRANYEQFQCRVVELQNQVCKIIKKCLKVYIEKRNEIFQYCQKFNSFKKLFQAIMNGDENEGLKHQLIQLIKNENQICECCLKIKSSHQFLIQVLFIIGKYYQFQNMKIDQVNDPDQWLELFQKDEKYYFEYLALNLDSQIAWQNIIRINSNKSYHYFDSIVKEPLEMYKPKFLYTKRIIQTIHENLPHLKHLCRYGDESLQILNCLKIKERQYHMVIKELQTKGITNKDNKQLKEYKESTKKYKEGLKKIFFNHGKNYNHDVKIRYLRIVEVRMKLTWLNIDKELKQDQTKQNFVIDIDEEDNDSKVLHRPSKNIENTIEIIQSVRNLIKQMTEVEKHQHVIHLQQDLTIQTYMFISSCIQYKIQKIINKVCNIRNKNDAKEVNSIMRDVQFYLSQLNHTISLFSSPEFISSNKQYLFNTLCFKHSDLQCQNAINSIESLFIIQKEPQYQPNQIVKQSNPFIRQAQALKKTPFLINRMIQEGKEDVIIIEEDVLSQQKSQKSKNNSLGSNSSRQNKKQMIKIDLLKHLLNKMRQSMEQKQSDNRQKLVKLKPIVTSYYFISTIIKISRIFNQFIRIFQNLPKIQLKKYKNRRSVCMSLLYSSQIIIKYNSGVDRANQLIKDYYNIKSDQLVSINLYNDKISTQKNELLAEFYNRILVHQIMKIRFIKHLFQIFYHQKNKQNLVMINRKLLKLSKGVSKDNLVEKEKEKQRLRMAGNSVVNVVVGVQVEKENKQNEDKQYQVRCYFLLFCQGVSTFVDITRQQSAENVLQQKYEKNLLQFKNRLKKNALKDEINFYFKKIDDFLLLYETKYGKKIKMKKSKKEKEDLQAALKPEEKIINKPLDIIFKKEIQGQKRELINMEQIKMERENSQSSNSRQLDKKEKKVDKKIRKDRPDLREKKVVVKGKAINENESKGKRKDERQQRNEQKQEDGLKKPDIQ